MITTKDLRPRVGANIPYDLIVHSIRPFLLPDTTQCCVDTPLHSILFLDRSLYRDMLRYIPPCECRKGQTLDCYSRLAPAIIKNTANPSPICQYHDPFTYYVMEYVCNHDYRRINGSISSESSPFAQGQNLGTIVYSLTYHPRDYSNMVTSWKKTHPNSEYHLRLMLEDINDIITTRTNYEFTHYCCRDTGINFKIRITPPQE